MHVVLWDTRRPHVLKDHAGGFGAGRLPPRRGVGHRLAERLLRTDRHPAAILYAHLAAAFARLGHHVQLAVDVLPPADLYVFVPALASLSREVAVMTQLLAERPAARVLVVGPVATVLPQAFAGLGVTVVKGEAEQLFWSLAEVLARPGVTANLGVLEDLDWLPPPDWSPLRPRQFRIAADFWQFPSVTVDASRGCPCGRSHCPARALDDAPRQRSIEAIADEIRHGMSRWGFRSFRLRDPARSLAGKRLFQLAELLEKLPQKMQFSLDARADRFSPETLRLLVRLGLAAVRVDLDARETDDPRQAEFFDLCRNVDVRTVLEVTLGQPDDTDESFRRGAASGDRAAADVGRFPPHAALSRHAAVRRDACADHARRLRSLDRLSGRLRVRASQRGACGTVAGGLFCRLLSAVAARARQRPRAVARTADARLGPGGRQAGRYGRARRGAAAAFGPGDSRPQRLADRRPPSSRLHHRAAARRRVAPRWKKIRAKDSVNTVRWFSKGDDPKAEVRNVLAPYSGRAAEIDRNRNRRLPVTASAPPRDNSATPRRACRWRRSACCTPASQPDFAESLGCPAGLHDAQPLDVAEEQLAVGQQRAAQASALGS